MATSGLAKWKGTVFFNCDDGGFSESLYAGDGGPNNFGDMMDAMKRVVAGRCRLSQTATAEPGCTNPLGVLAIRVTDLSRKRAAWLNTDIPEVWPGFRNWAQVAPKFTAERDPIGSELAMAASNDLPKVCAKVLFTDGIGHNANELIHAFPNIAYDADPKEAPVSGWTKRVADIDPDWIKQLGKYGDLIRANNLGFRYNVNIWEPHGPPFVAPVVGDSRPLTGGGDEPVYNAAKNTWTFTMAQPMPQQKMRLILRGFKSLNFLNGRQVGIQGPGANQITIQTLVRQGAGWDGTGTICPETYYTFSPLPTITVDPVLKLPGTQFNFMTTKKIGRPFDAERGRIRRRPR